MENFLIDPHSILTVMTSDTHNQLLVSTLLVQSGGTSLS